MKKNKQMMIFSIISIVAGLMLLYISGVFSSKQISDIPKKDSISSIEIYYDSVNDISKYHTLQDNNSVSEIYDVLLSHKKSTKSINDSPTYVNGKLTKIVLNDRDNNETSLFVYQSVDGNYYIEKPYEGIYEISTDEYNVFTQYFIEN